MTDERLSGEGFEEPEVEDESLKLDRIESACATGFSDTGEAVAPVVDHDFVLSAANDPVVATDATVDSEVEVLSPLTREDIDGLRTQGERLEQRLNTLATQFEREIRAEATREKVVNRLHAELQEYKQDLLLKTLRPVFVDLIQLHDDIGKVALIEPDAADESRRLIGLMQGFQQGIEDVLYRQGVEPFEVEGEAFDPKRQRVVATVATDDPALGRSVAARHRKGFRAGDMVIRPEVVSVYAYKP